MYGCECALKLEARISFLSLSLGQRVKVEVDESRIGLGKGTRVCAEWVHLQSLLCMNPWPSVQVSRLPLSPLEPMNPRFVATLPTHPPSDRHLCYIHSHNLTSEENLIPDENKCLRVASSNRYKDHTATLTRAMATVALATAI